MATTRLNSTSETDDPGSCVTCGSGFGTQNYIVKCEYCLRCFHYGCAGFNDVTYKSFKKLHGSGLALFHCEACKQEILELKSKVAAFQSHDPTPTPAPATRLDIVEQKIDKLADDLRSIVGPAPTVTEEAPAGTQKAKSYASVAARGVVSTAKIITVDEFNKVREEEAHRRSMVVVGLPEEGSDFEAVSRLVRLLDGSASVNEVFRMGRLPVATEGSPARPRLLKVHLASSSVARSLLGQSSKLKNSGEFKGVYIRRSMTREERQELSNLRDECRQLNTAESATDVKYVVVGQKLVKFTGCKKDDAGRLVDGVRARDWSNTASIDQGLNTDQGLN